MRGKKLGELGISNSNCFIVLLKPVSYQALGGIEKGGSRQIPDGRVRLGEIPEVLE